MAHPVCHRGKLNVPSQGGFGVHCFSQNGPVNRNLTQSPFQRVQLGSRLDMVAPSGWSCTSEPYAPVERWPAWRLPPWGSLSLLWRGLHGWVGVLGSTCLLFVAAGGPEGWQVGHSELGGGVGVRVEISCSARIFRPQTP